MYTEETGDKLYAQKLEIEIKKETITLQNEIITEQEETIHSQKNIIIILGFILLGVIISKFIN